MDDTSSGISDPTVLPKQDSYQSDAALKTIKEDKLGWDRFVSGIARAIETYPCQGGFVVGLQGKWGSGKTTLLSFVEERLVTSKKTEVFTYNPWAQPGCDHVESFFDQLAVASGYKKNRKRLARLLKGLSSRLRRTSLLPSVLIDVLVGAAVLLSVLGLQDLLSGDRGLGSAFLIIAALLYCLRRWSAGIGKLAELFDPGTCTLLDIKAAITAELEAKETRIIALIDDVDRLPPKDICSVFQLVKNNGDIKNLSFVLAYDRGVIEQVLAETYTEEYRSFTEKIIQLEFALPPPDQAYLDKFFTDTLFGMLSEQPANIADIWDNDRWGNYYHRFLRAMFSTLREAKRILNAIRLNMGLVINDGVLEVNPIDLVAIELIRIQFPSIYDFLRNNKDICVYVIEPTQIFGLEPEEEERRSKQYRELIESIPGLALREKISGLLVDLFPRLAVLGTEGSSAETASDEMRSDLRICVESMFDRYFLYGNYIGDVSSAEVAKLENAIASHQNAVDMVKESFYTDRLRIILDRLASNAMANKKPVFITDLLVFVFDVSDFLRESTESVFKTPVRFHVANLVEEVLRDFEPPVRANYLNSAMAASNGVAGPLAMFSTQDAERQKKSGSSGFLADENLQRLLDLARERAFSWLNRDEAFEHPQFKFLVSVLSKSGRDRDFEITLISQLKKPANFKRFLAQYVVGVVNIKIGDVAGSIEYEFRFAELDAIMPVIKVRDLADGVVWTEQDGEVLNRAMKLFVDGYQGYLSERNATKGQD